MLQHLSNNENKLGFVVVVWVILSILSTSLNPPVVFRLSEITFSVQEE